MEQDKLAQLTARLVASAQTAEAIKEHYILTLAALKQVPRTDIEAEIGQIQERIRAEWQAIGKSHLE